MENSNMQNTDTTNQEVQRSNDDCFYSNQKWMSVICHFCGGGLLIFSVLTGMYYLAFFGLIAFFNGYRMGSPLVVMKASDFEFKMAPLVGPKLKRYDEVKDVSIGKKKIDITFIDDTTVPIMTLREEDIEPLVKALQVKVNQTQEVSV